MEPETLVRYERAVLGAALSDPTLRALVTGALDATDFIDPGHGATLDALRALAGASGWVDWDSVVRVGNRRLLANVDGQAIARAGRGKTAEQIDGHVQALRAWASKRVAQRALRDALDRDTPPSEWFATCAGALSQAQLRAAQTRSLDGVGIVDSLWTYLSGDHASLETGIASLDRVLGGLRPRFYVIGARPAVGKTAFLVTLQRLLSRRGKRGLFFSAEMTTAEIAGRLLAQETGLDSSRIDRRALNESEGEQLVRAGADVARWRMLVDDTPGIRVGDIRARAAVEHAKEPLDYLLVDYLQKIHPNRRYDSREREVSEVSSELAELQKQLKIPVVVAAQIKRDASNREPELSDLRESGAIEQDANTVILLDRPATRKQGDDHTQAAAFVAKNRGGSTGKVPLKYRPELTQFCDPEPDAIAWNGGYEGGDL